MARQNKLQYLRLYHQACAAGMAALEQCQPRPMAVRGNIGTYIVKDGPCGFAWIKVIPGNCPFANWLKKAGIARKSYSGGVDISVSAGGQSMERKEAYARAFADVINAAALAGVKGVYPQSRMD